MHPRYIMIGGFLGAGKTTTVSRLAKHYIDQGMRVGIVTNDQTTDLVDTHSLRSQGFQVGEVAGSCFCCNFNALTSTMEGLGSDQLPHVILAEPVGSCTDLVATVIRPLTRVYGQPLDVAPYGVILKPSHGLKILRRDQKRGFSPKAEYIFRKQLEEADFILINRVDELSPTEIEELETLLHEVYPDHPTLRVSARTGEGFPELVDLLGQEGIFGQRVMDVDYDVYAEGEAELGWLNCQLNVESEREFDLDGLLLDLIGRLHDRLVTAGAEAAHLKTIGLCEGSYAVANLISNEVGPELSLPSKTQTKEAQVVINARVATDPQHLEEFVREEVTATCQAHGACHEVTTLQCFRPGRPVPTHRFENEVTRMK